MVPIFAPYQGWTPPYVVVGGSVNHSRSSFPQFALYDLYDAYELDPTDFGGPSGNAHVEESVANHFWGVYGGYHNPIYCNWDLGLEVGYKQLLKTHTVLYGASMTPFRDTNTDAWDILVTLKYQCDSGFNVFLKAGGAEVRTQVTQGGFIAPLGADVGLSATNPFRYNSYTLKSMSTEIEVGAGCRVLDHFEIHLSYTKIFSPWENDLVSQSTLFLPPRRAPSIGFFSLAVEALLF